MYYDYQKILSYNALINILIGGRGVGKTYGATRFVISQFLKKGEQFCYIRRYKPEIKKACPNFFEAVKNNDEFPDHKLTNKGTNFYCDDEVCGYAMTLATAQDLKSSNFSKVKTIIFDEFIIEEGQKKFYLKNEVFTFLNLLETIGRLRDIRVFMLANAGSVTNPYFMFFDIQMPYNSDIRTFKNGTILLQYIKNEEFAEVKKATRFGKMVAGTSFADYAIDNKFIDNNKNFIEKKKATSKFSFAFIYEGITYGVWMDYTEGVIYVSNDSPQDAFYVFAMTLQDHKPNTMMINSAKKYNCFKNFIQNFYLGNIRYESQKIKGVVYNLMQKMIN